MSELLQLSAEEFSAALRKNKRIDEFALESLLWHLSDILDAEPNVIHVSPPVSVCGDVHGQLLDVLQLFHAAGDAISPASKFLFLGDYVDRGHSSIETFAYLAFLKVTHPRDVVLLRGNHESRAVNHMYGLYNDCVAIYGHAGPWHMFNRVFDLLPVAAVVDNRMFWVRGGLSPAITWVDQIFAIDRKREIDTEGVTDLTWSDPGDVATFTWNHRGQGKIFGATQTRNFLWNNRLGADAAAPGSPNHGFVARSHQLVMEGYSWTHRDRLVIVWSAPNYCYKSGNDACVMRVGGDGAVQFAKFEKDPKSHIKRASLLISYFA
jgi:diadenosine tetraphosphatase ApaH/serine/threonine PP2A family protein phosphatase